VNNSIVCRGRRNADCSHGRCLATELVERRGRMLERQTKELEILREIGKRQSRDEVSWSSSGLVAVALASA